MRKNLPIECAQDDRPLRCPNFCLGLNEAFAVAWLRCHDLLSSDVASCEMICGTTPVLLCTTKNYNVLLQNYSVLQSTTPVLLCTTKYYSGTTLYYTVPIPLCTTQYYNVLVQYYSILQSTTPVLLYTTKYYASTSLYYKVLKRTTPVLLCTTKDYASTISVLQSTTTYYSSTAL